MSATKILVPVDGSPASLRAVDFAIGLISGKSGGALVLVHVLHMGALDPGGFSEAMPPDWLGQTAAQAAAQAMKDAIAKCEAAGVTYKAVERTGQTPEVINEVATEEGSQQIVMGSRGLNAIEGLFLGSVATRVMHITTLPVTLIK